MPVVLKRNWERVLGLSAALISAQTCWAAFAILPIEPPLITIDELSPSLALLGLAPGDILSAPPPEVEVSFGRLGLVAADEVDSFAVGPGPLDGQTYALLFSVNRDMTDGADPDIGLFAQGYRYNAVQQSGLNQAASDMFMSTELFDNSGLIPGLSSTAPANNVLVRDGGDAGGTDFALLPGPPTTVEDQNNGDLDDVDGLGSDPNAKLGIDRAGPDLLYYSLRRDSPSLPDFVPLGGTASGADIYVIDRSDGNPPELFANAAQLGLIPGPGPGGDNLSAFMVVRGNPANIGPFSPGDRVILSLDKDSPSLAAIGLQASDLLVVSFGGQIELFAEGDLYGLGDNAELNAFTVYLTTDIDLAVMQHGIKRQPGDLDNDNDVDQADLGLLLSAFGQNDGGDINGDGVTDLADLGLLLANYGFVHP